MQRAGFGVLLALQVTSGTSIAALDAVSDLHSLGREDVCASGDDCGISLRQLRGDSVKSMLSNDGQEVVDDAPTPSPTLKVRRYKPFEPKLYGNSGAPLRTFYMYRAASDETYPPVNVNTANLAGVLWYLHHEVVVQYPRKFGISKIVRLKVQMRATEPLRALGMEFGPRMAFDQGQCTGPFVCGRLNTTGILEPEFCSVTEGKNEMLGKPNVTSFSGKPYGGPYEWERFGYFVGCNKLGDFPFPLDPVYYPNAKWYTLPGPCPSMPFTKETEACLASDPGGYCEGVPTGAGDCTWNYEVMGELYLNELVGVDAATLDNLGGREYDPYTDKGIRFSWWDGINDTNANLRRIKATQAIFARKFPAQPKDAEMEEPPCDFDFAEFYKEFFLKDPRSGPCHDAKPGSECHTMVQWGRTEGIYSKPDWFPGLMPQSSFKDFQRLIYIQGKDECPFRPCFDDEQETDEQETSETKAQ